MAPKTPIKNEPVDLSYQKGCTPERNPITPVKLVDRPQPDPWTPTANLKMLVSAASPDMRDREKKKELFRPIENSEQSDTLDSLQVRLRMWLPSVQVGVRSSLRCASVFFQLVLCSLGKNCRIVKHSQGQLPTQHWLSIEFLKIKNYLSYQ